MSPHFALSSVVLAGAPGAHPAAVHGDHGPGSGPQQCPAAMVRNSSCTGFILWACPSLGKWNKCLQESGTDRLALRLLLSPVPLCIRDPEREDLNCFAKAVSTSHCMGRCLNNGFNLKSDLSNAKLYAYFCIECIDKTYGFLKLTLTIMFSSSMRCFPSHASLPLITIQDKLVMIPIYNYALRYIWW